MFHANSWQYFNIFIDNQIHAIVSLSLSGAANVSQNKIQIKLKNIKYKRWAFQVILDLNKPILLPLAHP